MVKDILLSNFHIRTEPQEFDENSTSKRPCRNCFFCKKCTGCINCTYCYECKNLEGKQFYYKNKFMTLEQAREIFADFYFEKYIEYIKNM